MKYAVTGNSKRFGKLITDELTNRKIPYIGFSRTTGYDFSDVEKIIRDSADCDVFINNACVKNCQVEILAKFYEAYHNTNKTIVNIGSFITEVDVVNIAPHLIYEQSNKLQLRYMSEMMVRSSSSLTVKYMSWGFHLGNPILEYFPHLLDATTIPEAIDQIITQW